MSNKKGLFALSPLFVFAAFYLVSSIAADDFYKVPLTVAFMFASIYAIAISGGFPLAKRVAMYSKGAGTDNLILMLWIFVMAGSFAQAAKDIGCVDATVNTILHALPDGMILPGLFLASCVISLSIGTSVGTIVALTPIAVGIAGTTGGQVPLFTAVVVGGSFFGDNLSFISDTTIAATSTQGCNMRDKFRVNSFIVIPVAVIVLAIYGFVGSDIQAPSHIPPIDLVKFIPYLLVLLTALLGMNVMAVLTIGILSTGLIGFCTGSMDFYGWLGSMGNGIMSMGELIIITMMAGGLLEMIKANGGIDYLIQKMTSHVNSKKGAELSVSALVCFVNICTANNTVAILTVGGIVKEIGDRYGLDNRKCASILDTVSCCIQGLLPYGAQLLMAAGLAAVSPIEFLPYLYYPVGIGFAVILSVIFRYPKRFST